MDTNVQHKRFHHQHRRRNNHFNYLEKSSSEPDLTVEFNLLSSRWRKGPAEFITVDELKFYRRRRPPDLHNTTSSSFSLYNESESYIPFSALKTEYQRQYGAATNTNTPRPALRRRSTSLKLPSARAAVGHESSGEIDADAEASNLKMGESEQHAEFHSYTEDELSNCRPTRLANRPDHHFADTIAQTSASPQQHSQHDTEPTEPLFASKHKTTMQSGQHAAERCHLHLSGELTYAPEYRSQFAGFGAPIEKCHSIPQIGNIHFHGKFDGMAEYRDSFRKYDRYARCAPIHNPGHLRTVGAGANGPAQQQPDIAAKATAKLADPVGGEYAEKFQAPPVREKARLARQEDQFSLTPVVGDRATAASRSAEAERTDNMAAAGLASKPERGRAKKDFLALKGCMDYSPEYRCTYLNFPRARPITNKPATSIKLGDQHTTRQSIKSPSRKITSFESNPMPPNNNVHEPNQSDLPFMCQPEVRRARQDLLLRKRIGPKAIPSTSETVEFGTIGNALVADAPAVVPLVSSSPEHRHELGGRPCAAAAAPPTPITFKLTVQNVDDPGRDHHRFKRTTTPKFGRRSSAQVKDAHRLRNRSRIVEGNREYAAGDHQLQQADSQPSGHSRKISSQSFVILKDPNKQSRWMKTSWYS